jgi:hypothetical protein
VSVDPHGSSNVTVLGSSGRAPTAHPKGWERLAHSHASVRGDCRPHSSKTQRPPNTQIIIPPHHHSHTRSAYRLRRTIVPRRRRSIESRRQRRQNGRYLRLSFVRLSSVSQGTGRIHIPRSTPKQRRTWSGSTPPSQPSVFDRFTSLRHCNFAASAPQLAPVSCSNFTRAGSRCHSRPKANSRNEKRVGLLSLRAKNQGRDRPNASIK